MKKTKLKLTQKQIDDLKELKNKLEDELEELFNEYDEVRNLNTKQERNKKLNELKGKVEVFESVHSDAMSVPNVYYREGLMTQNEYDDFLGIGAQINDLIGWIIMDKE